MPAHLLVLQHSPVFPLGLFGERFAARGAEITTVDPAVDDLPGGDPSDGLVILSGPLNATADEAHPHLPRILRLIESYVGAARPVLGTNLGAQLIARALGASISIGSAPEFGYADLDAQPAAEGDPVAGDAVPYLPVLQWHEDEFALPDGADLLLRCDRRRNQGFRYGRSTYGFQCHPEATEAMAKHWAILRGRAKNNPAVAVRLGAEITRHHARATRFGRSVADGWLDLVEAR